MKNLRNAKKSIAMLMTMVLLIMELCTAGNVKAMCFSQNPEMGVATGTDATLSDAIMDNIDMDYDDSIGEMIEETLSQEQGNADEILPYVVTSASISENTAEIEFSVIDDCVLIVAVFSESGTELVTSESAEISSEETYKELTFTEELPSYYLLKAYIVEAETLRPLSHEYVSELYTEEMQEFLSKTVADFPEERVLNLDSSESNNFAVYAEETIVVDEGTDVNILVSSDEENDIYTIGNAEDTIKNLQQGNLFSYQRIDGTAIIVKISSILVSEESVTITGENSSLEDVFEYVKINDKCSSQEAEVDTMGIEGLTYNGLTQTDELSSVEYEEEYSGSIGEASEEVEKIDIEKRWSTELSFDLNGLEAKNESDNTMIEGTISGDVTLELNFKICVYISSSRKYAEAGFDYDFHVGVEADLTGRGSIPLGEIRFKPCTGVNVTVEPSIIIEVEIDEYLGLSISGNVGLSISNSDGFTNLTTEPDLEVEGDAEITIFIGVALKPSINIVSDSIAEASLEAMCGAEAKIIPKKSTASQRDECDICFDIEIIPEIKVVLELSLLKKDSLSAEIEKTFVFDTIDAYLSVNDDVVKFNYGECPNQVYRTTFKVKDVEGNPIQLAQIGDHLFTNSEGIVYDYLSEGYQNVSINCVGYRYKAEKFRVDGPSTVNIVLEKKNLSLGVLEGDSSSFDEDSGSIINGRTGVKINRENFPDDMFRRYIRVNFDGDKNGVLSLDEADYTDYVTLGDGRSCSLLDISDSDISDLQGLQYFPNIEVVLCNNNNITELDLSELSQLVYINCSSNNLSELNLSKNTKLSVLSCYNNYITDLNFDSNKELESIDCTNNLLETLDTSNLRKLCFLYCANNKLKDLNVDNCRALLTLECNDNELTQLDVTSNSELDILDCSSNSLEYLYLNDNTYISLDCSKNSNLHYIDSNLFSEERLSADIDTVVFDSDNFIYTSPTITETAVDDTAALNETLDNISSVIVNEVNFPDDNFRAYISQEIDTNEDNILSKEEIIAVKKIDISPDGRVYLGRDGRIADAKGIENFPLLEEFICDSNNIETLDFRNNTQLQTIACTNNNLNSIDVSKNRRLKNLYCSGNMLTDISVDNCINLVNFNCARNEISDINLSGNTCLVRLNCEVNNLSSISLSNNTNLYYLNCSNNNITVLDLSNNSNLRSISCHSNEIDSLTLSNCSGLEILSCYDNKLSTIDLSKCGYLNYLYCSDNYLTTLNISLCKNLKILLCSDNKLSSLNITGNNSLISIDCRFNQINELLTLQSSIVANTKLETLWSQGNQFSTLNMQYYGGLLCVGCDENVECTTYDDDVRVITYPIQVIQGTDDQIAESRAIEEQQENVQIEGDLSEYVQAEEDAHSNIYVEAEEVYTENLPEYVPVETTAGQITYNGLIAGNVYGYYELKSIADVEFSYAEVLTAGNLLYVGQYTADEDGTLTLDYTPKEEVEDSVKLLIDMSLIDIGVNSSCQCEDIYYTAEETAPDITLTVNGYSLSEGKDFNVTGDVSATEIGDYQVTLVGKGRYGGTLDVEYSILENPVYVSSISLNKTNEAMKIGESIKLSTSVEPWNATNKYVNWTSSNASVATVDRNGNVTSVGVGSTTITATAKDGSGIRATCKITVTKASSTPIQKNGWRTENGHKYFYENGRLVKNSWIDDGSGSKKYVGTTGALVTNQFLSDGGYTYYLQADGSIMMNRLTYHPDGEHIIYFDENGHEVFDSFAYVKMSISGDDVDDLCYFNTYGYMYTDTTTYDREGKNQYYVNAYGVIECSGWFRFSDGGIGYARSDGKLMTDLFTYDQFGRVVYLQGNGHVALGLMTDGVNYYLMDSEDGHLLGMF